MKIRKRKRQSPLLELTPLVDVVFLLLTFYMLTSTFVRDKGIPLDLPQAEASVTQPRENVQISLLTASEVAVDGDTVLFSELPQVLAALITDETDIVVRSNRDLPIQSLLSVLDEVRLAGGSRVSVATSPRTPEACCARASQ